MAVHRRQHPGAPHNPFAEGSRGREVSYGDDSRYGPQKHPYKRFNFKVVTTAFAVLVVTYVMYSGTVVKPSEVSEPVSFNTKAASAGNSKSSFESQVKKVTQSESEEGEHLGKKKRVYPGDIQDGKDSEGENPDKDMEIQNRDNQALDESEEKDSVEGGGGNDDDVSEEPDEPDFADSQEDGTDQKKSEDGEDEIAVDESTENDADKEAENEEAGNDERDSGDKGTEEEDEGDPDDETASKDVIAASKREVENEEEEKADSEDNAPDSDDGENKELISEEEDKGENEYKPDERTVKKIADMDSQDEESEDGKGETKEEAAAEPEKLSKDQEIKASTEEKQEEEEHENWKDILVENAVEDLTDQNATDYTKEKEDNDSEEVKEADKPDLTESQEGGTEEKESGDGADEKAVDEKPWSDAMKGDSEAESVDEEEQQEDEEKDPNGDIKGVGEATPDQKVEDSVEEKGDETKAEVDTKVIKNSDDKEDKDDKNSTKIADDEAELDKTIEAANEKIHAEEKLTEAVKDETEPGQEKPLSVKSNTKAKSVDEDKQQEDEVKDTKDDKKGVDGVNPEKKVEDFLEKGANITETKVDDNEMTKSDGRDSNEDKNFTKIADDEIKSDKVVEVARSKTSAEEKLSKPLSQVERIGKSGKDVETKSGDAKDRNESPHKDAPADDEAAKAFAAHDEERGSNEDKNFTKIADDEIKSDKVVEVARSKTSAEEKLSKPLSQVERIAKSGKDVETKSGDFKDRNESPHKDAPADDEAAKAFAAHDEELWEISDGKEEKEDKQSRSGVDEPKLNKMIKDSAKEKAVETKTLVDDQETNKLADKENKDDKKPQSADDKGKPEKDVPVATDKTHVEEKLSKLSSQTQRIAKFMKDNETTTDDAQDEMKLSEKPEGKEKAENPEAPADDVGAKSVKKYATFDETKGGKNGGKKEMEAKRSKTIDDAKTSRKVGGVALAKDDKTKTQADGKEEAKNSGDRKMDRKKSTKIGDVEAKSDKYLRESDKETTSKTEKKVAEKPKVAALKEEATDVARRDVEKKSSLHGKKGLKTRKTTTSLRASRKLA